MSELATAARPAGLIAKTARRVAVALTISIAVALLMMHNGWRGGPFLRTIIVGLSATTAFGLFERFPATLPPWIQRWALQVVAVGVFMPLTTLLGLDRNKAEHLASEIARLYPVPREFLASAVREISGVRP